MPVPQAIDTAAEDAKTLAQKAESGDVAAQLQSAKNYWNQQDFGEAMKWYLKAAEQGDLEAKQSIGAMYVFGQGVDHDFTKAIQWFRESAEQGYAPSQYSLGLRYALGQGVEQDYVEAARWFGLAADQGVSDAQISLGRRYANGEGMPQDNVAAYAWYKIAAQQNPNAQPLLDELLPKMTAQELTEGDRRAKDFTPKTQ